VLLPETERVWDFLKAQPALAGFVLIGGTALALRIHHRRSDDLDLAYPQVRLPRSRLEALQRLAAQAGFEFERDDDEAVVQEFATAGMELHDSQQNFLVNRAVKVTFFVVDSALARILSAPPEGAARVATMKELFQAKCLVSAVRSKTRDWIDLYLLMREHGFSILDFQQAFQMAGVPTQCGIALSRLCSGTPQADDEGYAHLLQNPPTLSEIQSFFVSQRNALEIEQATQAFRQRQPPHAT
jgi:hypothetical protein